MINYQKQLDEELLKIQQEEEVKHLLLHSCCAPCSSYVLEYLSRYLEITVLYYNPNIYPPKEYDFRKEEQKRFIEELPTEHPVHFLDCAYDSETYYEAVRGMEMEPEGGKRCEVCFRLRLEEAAKAAKNLGMDYFTTTLSISPMKNAALLNDIGGQLSLEYGVKYLYSDFKKKNGFLRSTELSKEYGIYRQDYCGCVFSMRERHPEISGE